MHGGPRPSTMRCMTNEELRQVDAIIQRLLSETMRGLDSERPGLSIIDRPWFPWVALPCAMALGAVLALVAR
jgi:hypothetical protein